MTIDTEARKAEIVERMHARRAARQARRAAAHEAAEPEASSADAVTLADSADSPAASGESAAPRSQLMRLVVQHPLAAAGIAGVLLMIGPRRVLRAAGWLLPLVLRR